jgi:CRP/FNR family cyclic AMP-dependent transcriptional regulator
MTPPVWLADAVRNAPWAAALSPEQLARVQAGMSERVVLPGGYVCRKGEPVTHWIGTIEGLLKMSSVSPAGKIITFTGLLAGGWDGLRRFQSKAFDK